MCRVRLPSPSLGASCRRDRVVVRGAGENVGLAICTLATIEHDARRRQRAGGGRVTPCRDRRALVKREGEARARRCCPLFLTHGRRRRTRTRSTAGSGSGDRHGLHETRTAGAIVDHLPGAPTRSTGCARCCVRLQPAWLSVPAASSDARSMSRSATLFRGRRTPRIAEILCGSDRVSHDQNARNRQLLFVVARDSRTPSRLGSAISAREDCESASRSERPRKSQ